MPRENGYLLSITSFSNFLDYPHGHFHNAGVRKKQTRRCLVATFLAVMAMLILYSRRSTTLTNPQVWNEDGYYIVPQFLTDSCSKIFLPVQGYLISVPRLISNAALPFNTFHSSRSRAHDDVDWHLQAGSCAYFDGYSMPIQVSGHRQNVWFKEYCSKTCRQLEGPIQYNLSELYPYTIRGYSTSGKYRPDPIRQPVGSDFQILSNNISSTNYSRSSPVGYRPLGSFLSSDSDIGSILVSMKKGTVLLFASGPAGRNERYYIDGGDLTVCGRLPIFVEWCLIEFSSELLSNEFTVRLSDEGKSWGEWFAIGVRTSPPSLR